MKARAFFLFAILLWVLPLFSFRSDEKAVKSVECESFFIRKAIVKNAPYRQTEFEYGDFPYGGSWYAIYGDSSGNITNIYLLNGGTGPAVHSFHGTATPVDPPNPGSASVYFSPGSIEYYYHGPLWYI